MASVKASNRDRGGHIHLEVVEFRLVQTVEVYASLKAGQIKGCAVLVPDTDSYYRTNLNRMKYGIPTSHRPCRARQECHCFQF
jgi:hypothetical protein